MRPPTYRRTARRPNWHRPPPAAAAAPPSFWRRRLKSSLSGWRSKSSLPDRRQRSSLSLRRRAWSWRGASACSRQKTFCRTLGTFCFWRLKRRRWCWPPTRVWTWGGFLKDYFCRHSDLRRHENRFLGPTSTIETGFHAGIGRNANL